MTEDILLPPLSIEASTTLYPEWHRLYAPSPRALQEREAQLREAVIEARYWKKKYETSLEE